MIHFKVYETMVWLMIMLGIVLAWWLFRQSRRYELLLTESRKLQDDSTERALLLAEKNRSLIEKQDAETYSAILKELPDLLEKKEGFSCEKYGISQREYDIIQAVGEGLSNREIAEKLFLSEGTVRNYLSQILDKLELRDRTQLAVFYYKNGLIS